MTTSPPVDPSISKRTSGYGVRLGRTSGRPTFHAGLDFRGRRGDPVFAVQDGVVEFLARDDAPGRRTRGYGNVVAIRHASGQRTVYAHLGRLYVAQGQAVTAGKLIGTVGNTTNGKFRGMGPHLHFEVRNPGPGGAAPFPGPYRAHNIDPEPWLDQHGVRIAHNGAIALDAGRGGRAPQVPGETLAGLGQVDDGTLSYGYEGLPDEPLPDPWTFDPLSPLFVAGAVGAGALVLVVGASLGLKNVQWSRVFP
jgi:murein DD-endopeptidase MepM/ murein hydrolase activator NlpD